MIIRKTTIEDLSKVLELYAAARLRMLDMGNPQWEFSHPTEAMVRDDIARGIGYVVERDGAVVGAFVFFVGDDPTYAVIEDGAWLNDAPYGVIHRVAKDPAVRGLLAEVVAFCEGRIANLRVDTHEKNLPMRRALEHQGFVPCGRIYVADGTPRIAYQKVSAEPSP